MQYILMRGFSIQYTQIWSVLGDTEVMGKAVKNCTK